MLVEFNWKFSIDGCYSRIEYAIECIFGPAINAARGIAVQVQGAVQQFANNFQTAINPQITKSYASNDFTYMHSLICKGAKFSFYGFPAIIACFSYGRSNFIIMAKDTTCLCCGF